LAGGSRGFGCEREKKRLQRREKGWKDKRESRGGNLVVGWWLCWLLAMELVVGVGMVEEMVVVLAACGGNKFRLLRHILTYIIVVILQKNDIQK
jgi:hypothetical protein